mgnify:CR=1 FL=1
MSSLLNKNRPPVFCPGCAHETVTRALDMAFSSMRLQDRDIVIVSDIGCSGLFDTFFNTHAFHGLHGRARPPATLSRPLLRSHRGDLTPGGQSAVLSRLFHLGNRRARIHWTWLKSCAAFYRLP